MKNLLAVIAFFTILSSCSKDKDFTDENEKEIIEYIDANNLDATRSESGLYYVITKPGTGIRPNIYSTVTVAYTGYFTDGNVFDSSNDAGISFPLQNVIKGWTEGLQLMPVGSKYEFYIPAELAYGERAPQTIGPNQTLIFEVELLDIVK